MPLYATIRRILASAPAALLTGVLCASAVAQTNGGQRTSPPRMAVPHTPGINHQGGSPHLQQWMESHRNLTPEQQQKALGREPGFRDLPPETQQRMRDRLTQLNNMSPERRQRLLEHNEAIARLAPEQRQQFRNAMDQFKSLPTDRRREVARAFRELRQAPESQRQSLMNSGRYSQFSEQERNALSNLLSVEPYLPLRHPGGEQPQ